VRAELAAESVDLVLVDSMRLGALRAAEQAGLPTVVVMHTLHRYHTHGWSRGPIGVVAALRGMRPGRLWNTADRVLVATDRELDPVDVRRRPGNVRHVGVVPTNPPPTPRQIESGDQPLVLVSLPRSSFKARPRPCRRSWMRSTGCPSGVTTGAIEPRDLSAPAGFRCTDTWRTRRSYPRHRW
jgi:hypothetical protein